MLIESADSISVFNLSNDVSGNSEIIVGTVVSVKGMFLGVKNMIIEGIESGINVFRVINNREGNWV